MWAGGWEFTHPPQICKMSTCFAWLKKESLDVCGFVCSVNLSYFKRSTLPERVIKYSKQGNTGRVWVLTYGRAEQGAAREHTCSHCRVSLSVGM